MLFFLVTDEAGASLDSRVVDSSNNSPQVSLLQINFGDVNSTSKTQETGDLTDLTSKSLKSLHQQNIDRLRQDIERLQQEISDLEKEINGLNTCCVGISKNLWTQTRKEFADAYVKRSWDQEEKNMRKKLLKKPIPKKFDEEITRLNKIKDAKSLDIKNIQKHIAKIEENQKSEKNMESFKGFKTLIELIQHLQDSVADLKFLKIFYEDTLRAPFQDQPMFLDQEQLQDQLSGVVATKKEELKMFLTTASLEVRTFFCNHFDICKSVEVKSAYIDRDNKEATDRLRKLLGAPTTMPAIDEERMKALDEILGFLDEFAIKS